MGRGESFRATSRMGDYSFIIERGKVDYSNVVYKKTALSQVIVRLDFSEYVESEKLFVSSISDVIQMSFPKKSMQQLIRFQTMKFTFDSNGAKSDKSQEEGIQQEYMDSVGNKLIISNKFLIMEVNLYSSYEELMNKLAPIIRMVLSTSGKTIIRTGIRYINIYNESSIKPQKNFFTVPVSALVESKTVSESQCIRMMSLSEYNLDDLRLNFRYGQYNPNYPQPIKHPSFVLDFDCFCELLLSDYNRIMEHIKAAHDEIQRFFEDSITDSLRKVMG